MPERVSRLRRKPVPSEQQRELFRERVRAVGAARLCDEQPVQGRGGSDVRPYLVDVSPEHPGAAYFERDDPLRVPLGIGDGDDARGQIDVVGLLRIEAH